MSIANYLSLVVSNLFVEHFEKTALDTADNKPTNWLRYIDVRFVVWPHGAARLQQFVQHLNSLGPTITFTVEVEDNDNGLPFLDVLVMKSGPKLAMKVYWKPTHASRYLLFKSNHPHHVNRGVIHCLMNRANFICQNQKYFDKEIKNIRYDLVLSGYPQEHVTSMMKQSLFFRSNIPGHSHYHTC